MALVLPNVGAVTLLNYLTNKDAPEDLVVRLYSNNKTPAVGDVVGYFTETTFAGYAAVTTDPVDWTITAGTPTAAVHTRIDFTSSAGSQSAPVYGYYVTRVTTGDLVYAERFPAAPVTVVNDGDQIRVTPRITAATVA